ncbi:MAG: ABC transporter substrate-binding protein [Xanthobacteraceae bacterium]
MKTRIHRRGFFKLLAGAAAAPALPSRPHAQDRVWRVGMLETVSVARKPKDLAAFRQGLQSFGYVEGRNLQIDYRSAEGRPELFPTLARDLVKENVDVIVTRGTPAAAAAKNATTTTPIVMAAIGDPLLVVASLAHPGGNMTGLSAFVTDLTAKRVEILRDLVPELSSIGALLNMSNGSQPAQWTNIQQSAKAYGMQSVLFDVRKTADLSPAFDSATQQHIGAIVIEIDAVTQANRNLIIQLALKHRLPAIYPSREFVDAGGLMSYGVDYPDLYRRAAAFVDKIIKGAKPADLPVEQPTKFEMVVNQKAAMELGVALPPAVLLRADDVIE